MFCRNSRKLRIIVQYHRRWNMFEGGGGGGQKNSY